MKQTSKKQFRQDFCSDFLMMKEKETEHEKVKEELGVLMEITLRLEDELNNVVMKRRS
ncbi:hypothetical protein HYT25_04310 [Candidatus Pacearchaeota archaeon]|nr:hypothetical protein [Candidatus Pacearchaeota archaeon]